MKPSSLVPVPVSGIQVSRGSKGSFASAGR